MIIMSNDLTTQLYGSLEPIKVISHSEVQTFLDCQKKWRLRYGMKLKLETIHTRFGSMAHKVLESREIPLEDLYPEFKEAFNIRSWESYFTTIFYYLDLKMKDYVLVEKELEINHKYLKGIIDCVWKHKTTGKLLITDYKFTNSKKDQMDLLIDQQLYVYSGIYSMKYNVPLKNIEVGFISIPKSQLDEPRVLAKGGLSKDKSQNVSYDKYMDKILELNLNVEDYEDILNNLSGREVIGLEIAAVSQDMFAKVFTNLENVYKEMQKGYVLERTSSFDCKRCDLFEECKLKGLG